MLCKVTTLMFFELLNLMELVTEVKRFLASFIFGLN